MATSMLIRFFNFRNFLKINKNVLGISCTGNTTQCLESIIRLSSTQQSETLTDQNNIEISHDTTKSMQIYMKRIKKHAEFMEKEVFEYEKGKRHLANMMGMDPEHFTQEDVNRSLEYLFPSGLFDPKARPLMKHPKDIFPPQKEAEFSADGKPFHPFFYMVQPFYYEMLHNIVEQLRNLDDIENKFIKSTGTLPNENKMDSHGSVWITKVQLEKLLLEKLIDEQYEYFIKTMERLLDHPLSQRAKEFIMKYRTILTVDVKSHTFLPIMYTEDGKPYVKVFPCQRKTAIGTVTVFGEGTGKITINGKDISYFKDMQSRQQVSFCYIILLLLIRL